MVEYAHYDRLLTENATLKAEQARPRADLVERDENAGRLIDTLTRQRDEARTERDALKATLAKSPARGAESLILISRRRFIRVGNFASNRRNRRC